MSTLPLPSFNPFTFANRLKAAGVPEKQAVAEAELLHDVLAQQTQAVSSLENQVKTLAVDTKRDAELLATKGDLADVRNVLKEDIAAVRSELKEDIAAVRSELKEDIAVVRSELKEDIAVVRSELAEARSELKGDIADIRGDIKVLYWMFGALIAGLFAVAATLAPAALRLYFGG